MIINMNGGGKGASFDAQVDSNANVSSISFQVAKEPKSWSVMFYAPQYEGAGLSILGSNKYIMCYEKNDEFSGGLVATSSTLYRSSTVTASYNNGTFTLTASGGEKFHGVNGAEMAYKLSYSY